MSQSKSESPLAEKCPLAENNSEASEVIEIEIPKKRKKREGHSLSSCKKNLLLAEELIKVFNKLNEEEQESLVPFLNDQALHLFFNLVYNLCVDDRQEIEKTDQEKFKEELTKIIELSHGKRYLNFYGDPEISFDKKKKRLLQSQVGEGFGLIVSLLPLITGLISKLF